MSEHKDLKVLKGKNRLQALVPSFLWEVGLAQTHGDTKYAPLNWQGGKDHPEEYHGAILRHLLHYMAGEKYDPETGLHHMAHLTCSAMFLFWFDNGDAIPARTCHCPACNPQAPVAKQEPVLDQIARQAMEQPNVVQPARDTDYHAPGCPCAACYKEAM